MQLEQLYNSEIFQSTWSSSALLVCFTVHSPNKHTFHTFYWQRYLIFLDQACIWTNHQVQILHSHQPWILLVWINSIYGVVILLQLIIPLQTFGKYETLQKVHLHPSKVLLYQILMICFTLPILPILLVYYIHYQMFQFLNQTLHIFNNFHQLRSLIITASFFPIKSCFIL